MSPTPFHRKGPWKKTSSGQLSKTECGDGQAGAEQQKATPRQENKQCAFFLSFFSFSLFYLRKKKKFWTLPAMNTLRSQGLLTANRTHSSPSAQGAQRCKLLNPMGTFAPQTVHNAQSSSAGPQWPGVGCGGAQSRWAPPALNCALYW